MRYLPLFLDLRAGKVALIGSGPAAVNKLRLLRAAGADVRWYSEDIDVAEEMLLASRPPGRLELAFADPLQANFREFRLLVSATGTALDDAVAALARTVNVPVNVVDRPDLSSFIFPAVVDRGEVVVAIGTGGASPVLARRLRERIEAMLPARIGELASLLRRHRDRLSLARDGAQKVRRFWERAVDGPVGAAALAGRGPDAEAALIRDIANLRTERAPTGTVHLVGAGPGDPDLLTLRALHVLQGADIIFYDELVTPEILDRARRDAERIFVGKRRGAPGIGQDEINRRLRDAAGRGLNVVRLKGGDPFVFGRGGEELDYLRRQDVPVIVVPGITAALGCAAEAGLPLTLRGEAARVTLVTAHQADDAAAADWSGLGDPATTVVVYMGLSAATAVRDGLIAAGRAPRTPIAVLARGTRPDGASVVGTLDELESLAADVGDGPAVIVVGNSVSHSDPWLAAIVARAPREIAA
ncbi:MAG: uroporphyrinogen-III C-methyltransferase [Xanthobacteraceae bacterium]|nr:uroporphyrinogen-III C-methyltransferase [Xanthobacteraceae bacterium]